MVGVSSAVLSVLLAMTLLSCTTAGPLHSIAGTPANATNTTLHEEEVERQGVEEVNSCPGYYTGAARRKYLKGCRTGTSLGAVDHCTAFGFSSRGGADWDSCALPSLPQAK